jgi:hypothetical protein
MPGERTRFKPGQSGNPAGKPKGAISLSAQLRKALKKTVQTKDGTKLKTYDAIVTKAIQAALQGDTAMMRLIFDRVDGRVKDLEFEPGGPTEAEQIENDKHILSQLLGDEE